MQPSDAAPIAFRSVLTKLHIVRLSIASALLFGAVTIPDLSAQQPAPVPPAAPVPSQILQAKKVFIVNAAGDNDPHIAKFIGGPNAIYDQFYADVKNSRRFEIVSAPADADVVLEATLTVFPFTERVYTVVRLAILDPKSNVLLWTIAEPVNPALFGKTARKNVAQTLDKLTQDLTALTPKQ